MPQNAQNKTSVKNKSEKKEKKAPKAKEKNIMDVDKSEIITMFAQKTGDTGSPEVQVALATHKVINLAKHLDLNPKDNHSRRGLLKIISKRRRILNYLQSLDDSRYKEVITKLGLKK